MVDWKKIEGVQRQLIEHSYAGSYGGAIDLAAVNNLLGGAVLEITKLQNQIEGLNKRLAKKIEKSKKS